MAYVIPDIPDIADTIPEARPHRQLTLRSLLWGLGWFAVTVLVLIVLPFVVLLRTSTYLYLDRAVAGWLALASGGALALVVLTLYGAWASKRLTGTARARFVAKWVALPLVLFYCGYTLLHLASVNAKTVRVQSYYTSLHPILRAAVATLILADDELVVTDLSRTPEDYAAMGLPVYEASLHYPQKDGYVHAMDLRTIGRPMWRNILTQNYFRLLGLRTLRHVGSADHLHVSLPPR